MRFTSKFIRILFRLSLVKKGHFHFLAFHRSTPLKAWVNDTNLEISNIHDHNVIKLLNKNGSNKLIFYLHGGGYQDTFSIYTWRFLNNLVKKCKVDIIAPDYPLVPTTYKDIYAYLNEVYKTVLRENSEKEIVIMGDSAGGGLALGFCMYLRDNNIVLPTKNIMISPWLDVTCSNKNMLKYEKNDLIFDIKRIAEYGNAYAKKDDQTNPYVSPIYGNVQKLNQMYLFIGDYDVLYADALKFKKICQDNNVSLNFFLKRKMLHIYPIMPIYEADEFLRQLNNILYPKSRKH